MARKRHHIVSRSYQRLFADGERLKLIDKSGTSGRPRIRIAGTTDIFVRDHFNSYLVEGKYIDALEDEWSRIEASVFRQLRPWAMQGTEMPHSRESIKVLAALHFARSRGFRSLYAQIADVQVREAMDSMPADPVFQAAWMSDFGAEIRTAEAQTLISEYFSGAFGENAPFQIETMVNMYNKALEKLIPLHVQALHPRARSSEFVLGDNPVVLQGKRTLKVGAGRLALGDANQIFMPISRKIGVMFTSDPEDDELIPPLTVRLLNHLTWCSAFDQVACHPSVDPSKALPWDVM